MIQLESNCLIFQTSFGESIPCSAEEVTIELIGETNDYLDPTIIQNAAQAVLHYFKQDLGRTAVSVAEFTEALERVLRSLGLTVKSTAGEEPANRVSETDLRQVAAAAGVGFELAFFQHLRAEVRQQLALSARVLRFGHLRDGVKMLMGAKRWNERCRDMHNRTVIFLRRCLSAEAGMMRCALIVQ